MRPGVPAAFAGASFILMGLATLAAAFTLRPPAGRSDIGRQRPLGGHA